MKRNHTARGFTLVEIAIGIALLGLVLLAFAGMTSLVQKGAGSTRNYADAQQNARSALDYMTSQLRQAGSDVAAYDGQGTIVSAGPYQLAFNGDIDAGATIQGEAPLTSIDQSKSGNTVPHTGSAIYTPAKTFSTGAETVVFTLDSDESGTVASADHGDQDEEKGNNPNTYVLMQYRYGAAAGANEVRGSDVAMVRGPIPYDNGDNPPPLFEYFYDDDNDLSTADKLWGDTDPDGELSSSEVGNLTDMTANLLGSIRMVKVNVVAEGNGAGTTKDNGGFAHVVMSSRVYIRNADSHNGATVYGTVYFDANANSKKDSGENGLANVVMTITQTGRKTTSDAYGQYSLAVDPGTWTVKQTLPTGYTAVTPASVNVTANKGETKTVDFADKSSVKTGYIVGTVWDDANLNAVHDGGEAGQSDIVLTLSNAMTSKTRSNGYYRFTGPVGSYTITETIPAGYTSTTASSGSATLVNQGDSVVTNFGISLGAPKGTLAGYVFEDINKDGVLNNGEKGISGVSMQLSNNSTTNTDNSGYYEFKLDAGKYDLYEQDATGYTSTTPNIIESIAIVVSTTITKNFGDIQMKDLTFVEVAVSNTQRPLSVSVADFQEDNKGDNDIVLGTPTATNNIFLYLNGYNNSGTPLTSLFTSTPTKSYRSSTDVNAIKWMERDGDSYADVLAGVESSGNNVQDWYNDNKKGMLGKASNAPNRISASGASNATTRFHVADLNGDGMLDMIVGNKSKVATWAGGFEEQQALAPGSYTSKQVTTTNGKGTTLGVVAGIATGDLDKDGDQDLVIGSNNGNTWGHVDIFLNNGSGALTWSKRLLAKAGVNDVACADLQNDGKGEPDILVATTQSQNVGAVQVWLNKDGVYGLDDKTSYVYNSDEDQKVPDKTYNTSGEALCVAMSRLDADVYPEIIIGTRSSSFYTGDLWVIQEPGTNNEKITNVKINVAGEVVSFDIADMNLDSFKDIVVTTRTSASAGKLAIYFLNNVYALP
jgi:type II secretory pathway pseudopilin PulG